MIHRDALKVAERLVERIAPACIRCEIAGGVRRKKQEPHDIEIVVLPIMRAPVPEFGQTRVHRTLLDAKLYELEQLYILRPVKGGDKLKVFDVDPDKLGVQSPGYIKLDLFIVTPPAQWGPIFTIRTGPSEFSHWCVTPKKMGGAMPDGFVQKDGSVYPGEKVGETVMTTGPALEMPEEIDYLNFLGLGWVAPAFRQPQWGKRGGAA